MKKLISFAVGMLMMASSAWANTVVLNSTTTTWEDGNTYVLISNITYNTRITVNGTVHLQLYANKQLTALEGIELYRPATLIIDGEGTLQATGTGDNAGIGAYVFGTLIINSGKVIATGGPYGAGIGGSRHNHGDVGALIVNGGVVNATGGSSGGAGIGGGYNDWSGDIYGVADSIVINGGQVTATAGDSSASGIGKGRNGGSHGSLTLGWTYSTDFINASSYNIPRISFEEGKEFVLDGTDTQATTSNIDGQKIVPYFTSVSGYCGAQSSNNGQDVTWNYDESTHTLTISGTGAMADFEENRQPWSYYLTQMACVIVEDGVTTIGNYAFNNSTNLTKAVIGNDVTSIGDYAFSYCKKLVRLTMGEEVSDIGNYAFQYCESLNEVTIPTKLTYLNNGVFSYCKSLILHVLATTPPDVANDAFSNSNITQVLVPIDLAMVYVRNQYWSRYLNKIEIEEPKPIFKGDMNDDGKLSLADVTLLVDEVLNYDPREYVNLGLPSGTLWAICNVGADTPEDYGQYFAWGETVPLGQEDTSNLTNYTATNSYIRNTFNWTTYKWCKGTNQTMTKYSDHANYGYEGFTDGLSELELQDDAAYVNWGRNWRMPSYDQLNELINTNYTNCQMVTQNGVYGMRVTSKMPGYTDKSIFIPAAGSYYGDEFSWKDTMCNIWTRTRNPSLTFSTYCLGAYSTYIQWKSYERCSALPIRPVRR